MKKTCLFVFLNLDFTISVQLFTLSAPTSFFFKPYWLPFFTDDTSRKGSFSTPSNTSQISLYRVDEQDPYGFGLRVVGQQIPVDPQQQQQQQPQLCARVLWISPGGPAQRAGIKVGDRVKKICSTILYTFSPCPPFHSGLLLPKKCKNSKSLCFIKKKES